MDMKELLFFCLGAVCVIIVSELIRVMVDKQRDKLRDFVLDNYKVKDMKLFAAWIEKLSWREISFYKKRLNGFRVPDETSDFLASYSA